MPKRYDNTIRKLFLRNKTIKAIPSSTTRIRSIVYIKDPKEAPNIDYIYIENIEVKETTRADIIITGYPVKSDAMSVINLDAN